MTRAQPAKAEIDYLETLVGYILERKPVRDLAEAFGGLRFQVRAEVAEARRAALEEGEAKGIERAAIRARDAWQVALNGSQMAGHIRALSPVPAAAPDARDAEMERLRAETADLKMSVIAMGSPWAISYAKGQGLPKGHLLPVHYDILAAAGARMDDFVRTGLVTHGDGKGAG